MGPSVHPPGWRTLAWWVLATALAWPVGLLGSIVVAYAVNVVYPKETNLVVGLVLGAVVGAAQQLVLRGWLPHAGQWAWRTAAGMGIPFFVAVIVEEATGPLPGLGDDGFLGLTALATAGGLLAGWLQRPLLRPVSSRSGWWAVAFAAACGTAWFSMRWGMLAGTVAGGTLLGLITGVVLWWLLRAPTGGAGRDAGPEDSRTT